MVEQKSDELVNVAESQQAEEGLSDDEAQALYKLEGYFGRRCKFFKHVFLDGEQFVHSDKEFVEDKVVNIIRGRYRFTFSNGQRGTGSFSKYCIPRFSKLVDVNIKKFGLVI